MVNFKRVSGEAIVLHSKDYKDADKLVTLYTKDRGKVRAIAKGVKKLTSRKRGHLEVFSRINFSGSLTNDFCHLTEAEAIETYENVRKSLPKSSLAYYFLEVVNRTTNLEEENQDVFWILCEYLEKIDKGTKLKEIRLSFLKDLLVKLGYITKESEIDNLDLLLSEITERKLSSVRVAKKILK